LVPDPRDISQLIKELKRNRVTVMSAVNTLYGAMLRHPGIREVDFRNLRASISGAMAMQQTVADDWKSVTGCPMVEAYGLTEASGIAVANPLSTIDCKGRIGIPLPSIEVELRDDEGKPVGFDTPGELWIRGPNVMHGYWNRPDESAKVCDRRNFVATGDITIMDRDGFLKIVDRKKDVILVSGFNVFPAEIEDVLSRHPGILDVAAVGRSDPHSGEAVTIFVVARHSSLTEEAVITFARRHLTSYKVPSEVVLMPSLPKSPVGKTLRRILREQVGPASAHRHGHRRRAEARR
jgi:long-chain acyl-CoA synthetase